MDLLHQHLRPGMVARLRGEILSAGLLEDVPDEAIAPAAPPVDFVERLRRACRDDGLTVFMRYPDRVWFLGAIGWFNRLPAEHLIEAELVDGDWNRDCTAVMPMMRLKRADGTDVIGQDIRNRWTQDEAIAVCALASCVIIDSRTGAPVGVRPGHQAMYDVAKGQLDAMESAWNTALNEKRDAFAQLPWWARKQLRDELSDGTTLRQERVAAMEAHERRHRALTERHHAPWRSLVAATERAGRAA